MTGNQFRKRFPLLVPSWIWLQLVRANLPAATLLNLPKLLQVCSLEDVTTMYCLNTLQEYINKVFGPGLSAHQGLAEYWFSQFGCESQRVLDVMDLYRSAPEERLLFETPQELSPEKPVEFKPFLLRIEGDDTRTEAIAIVLKPGYLGGAESQETQKLLVREYIRQSYAFTDYATLAQDPLYERYLKFVAADKVSEPA
jgi:hypothetical protein